jgi:hypothetical protein
VQLDYQPPLDGISLLPLLGEEVDTRTTPMGFWDYPIGGIGIPSHELMLELLEAQKAGKEPDQPSRLRLDAGRLDKEYPEGTFPGHAAWFDWPWKLHRRENEDDEGDVSFELYNLAEDPNEERDLVAQNPDLAESMKSALEDWQASVVHSLNGGDYQSFRQ